MLWHNVQNKFYNFMQLAKNGKQQIKIIFEIHQSIEEDNETNEKKVQELMNSSYSRLALDLRNLVACMSWVSIFHHILPEIGPY